jgi:hypothetical protein
MRLDVERAPAAVPRGRTTWATRAGGSREDLGDSPGRTWAMSAWGSAVRKPLECKHLAVDVGKEPGDEWGESRAT